MTTPDAICMLTRALTLKMQVLAYAAPTTANHLANLADNEHDGYPHKASGAGNPGHNPTSSTEAAVIKRDDRNSEGEPIGLGELWDYLASLKLAIDHALRFCDTHSPRIAEKTLRNLRCQGTDYDHTCTNIADPLRKDRRCIECGRTIDAKRQRAARTR